MTRTEQLVLALILAVILLMLLTGRTACAYENSHENYGAALKAAREQEKVLFVFFTADWCPPCNRMKEKTIYPLLPEFKRVSVVYLVDIDDKKEKKTIRAFQTLPGKWQYQNQVPTYYLTNQGAKVLVRKGVGYKTRRQFVAWWNNTPWYNR